MAMTIYISQVIAAPSSYRVVGDDGVLSYSAPAGDPTGKPPLRKGTQIEASGVSKMVVV